MEKNKTRKINTELKSIIQKQAKLIEVLRKKCAHLEAARVLEFTEGLRVYFRLKSREHFSRLMKDFEFEPL